MTPKQATFDAVSKYTNIVCLLFVIYSRTRVGGGGVGGA